MGIYIHMVLLLFVLWAFFEVTRRLSTNNAGNRPGPEAVQGELGVGENPRYLLTETGERYRVSEIEPEKTLVESVNDRGQRLSAKLIGANVDEAIDRILTINTPQNFVPNHERVMARRVQKLLPNPQALSR